MQRTAWHVFFAYLLRKRGPRWLEVRDEVPLSKEPPRLDYLLLRHRPDIPDGDPGQTLLGLWPLLPTTTIAELKTIGRPYRPRNLDRLFGYLHLYFSAEDGGDEPIEGKPAQPSTAFHHSGPPRRARVVERAADMAGLLVVPARTPTLDEEIVERGLVWNDLNRGYAELTGGLFRLFVAEVDVVAEEEDDDVLRLFGHERERTLEARRFWAELVGSKEAKMKMEELEGFEEVERVFLDLVPPERRMIGLTPEQRVAGLAPEQRVADLTPEQRLLLLPDEMLRALSADFIEKLPEPTRGAIRKRLGR